MPLVVEKAALLELVEVLRRLGVHTEVGSTAGGQRADLLAEVGGREIPIEVKTRSTVTAGDVDRLVEGVSRGGSSAWIVVADRVVEPAREALRRTGWGWLDRRGHLRLEAPGVLIDVDVPSTRGSEVPGDPLSGTVGLEVATWMLADPEGEPAGVRELARELDRAPSSVSEAFRRLEAHGLVTSQRRPVVPELFWATSDRWSATPRQALLGFPQPGDSGLTQRLQLGLDQVEDATGWALTDTLAAAAYGAPVGVASGTPPDFLVPSGEVARLAKMVLGASRGPERGCTVRAAPARWACQRRIDGARVDADTHWPLAHPLFVALDLAADPGRGRDILSSWTPPDPWRRVW